jgi:hypothetical protein
MGRFARFALLLAGIQGLVVTPGTARAQTAADLETARSLFREGRDLRAKGDLLGALEKLKAAHAAGRTPITGMELARTHAMVGQLVEAREVALDVARIPVAADETERSAEARTEAAHLAESLRERIPTLTVHVTGAPAGAVPQVFVDGEELPAALIGEPRKLDPGAHVIAVRAPDGATAMSRATVAERDAQEVAIAYPVRSASRDLSTPRPYGVPASPDPERFVYGAHFALVPQLFLPPQEVSPKDAPNGTKPVTEVDAGIMFELGASLTDGFEIMVRGLATAGSRKKPVSDLVGVGPAMSFRLGRRWWVGATLLVGRGDTEFLGYDYATDWVFAPTIDVSFAAIEWHGGQWLVGLSGGYYFVNERVDSPLFFVPLTFGYRAY